MNTRQRLSLAQALALVVCLLPTASRLIYLQIIQSRHYGSKAAGEFKRSLEESSPRADILDRHGRILAHSVPAWSCFVDKAMVKAPIELAAQLEPLMGISRREILFKLKTPGRTAILKRGMSFNEAARLKSMRIASIGVTAGEERVYPNADLALSLLGKVDSEGRGVSGVESAFDAALKGRRSKLELIRDGSGRMIYERAQTASAPKPFKLTIDRDFQYYSEQALEEAHRKFSIQSGLVAVQNPANGEILAMAIYPANPLKNPFLQDSFEPGSTFKVVTAAAALAESSVTEQDKFFCENGTYEIAPGAVITDHEPLGWLNLSGILEKSSNIGMAKVAARLGRERFYRYARAFGFGGRTGITLAGETAGTLKNSRDVSEVDLAASSYGYGVAVSGLQLLGAYSAIANGGTLWEPIVARDGPKAQPVRRIAPQKTIAAIAAMLEAVVERGTGVQAQVPGYRVAGKTGTTRKLNKDSKKYFSDKFTASFAGFLPASAPRWSILIVLNDPQGQYYGAQVAAPLFAKLAKELLAIEGVPPDNPQSLKLAALGR